MTWQQISLDSVDGDPRPVAHLRAEPAQLARACRLRFEGGEDDFDRYEAAGVQVGNRVFVLLRYTRNPVEGTEVRTTSAAPVEAARTLVDALDVAGEVDAWHDGVVWQRGLLPARV